MTIPRTAGLFLAFLSTLLACGCATVQKMDPTAAKAQEYFGAGPTPPEVMPLYDEVATYHAKSGSKPGMPPMIKEVQLDLRALIKDSKVKQVVIGPFDNEFWYEPNAVPLSGFTVNVKLDVNKSFIVALDLGEVARNNYQAISQLNAAGGLIPGTLKPKLCQVILCSPDSFPLERMATRIPEVENLPFEIGNVLPPLPVGPVNRSGNICNKCFDREPNIIPCVLWKWCGHFPISRKVYVRKNIYTLSPAEITTLRNGVGAMKARPASDPTSWWYQARMHAVDSGTALALQDQCQHRQFLFFSWHRMFVYYFERILRKASGDPNFAQPYWNYTDVAAQGAIPEAYRLPADEALNPLYDPTRASIYNSGASLPPGDVSYASAFNLTNFTATASGVTSFGGRTVTGPMHFPLPPPGSGQIELSPHNNVHNDIGGATGHMASGESPKDPVFWLHHSNIDRLWKRWIALGNGRSNPTGDSVWMSHVFTFFDENGNQVNLTGAQVLNTVSQLGYRYDDDPLVLWPLVAGQSLAAARKLVFEPEVLATAKTPVKLGRERVDVQVPLPDASRVRMAATMKAGGDETLTLRLKDIRYDAPVGLTYLLFLNLPPDAKQPDHTHPSFIGTLGFFGGMDHKGHENHETSSPGLTEEYDITRVVRRIGLSGEQLRISAIPSLPMVPEGREDLRKLRDQMVPHGNPRFGEVEVLRIVGK